MNREVEPDELTISRLSVETRSVGPRFYFPWDKGGRMTSFVHVLFGSNRRDADTELGDEFLVLEDRVELETRRIIYPPGGDIDNLFDTCGAMM